VEMKRHQAALKVAMKSHKRALQRAKKARA
jgi:hypothetical protein